MKLTRKVISLSAAFTLVASVAFAAGFLTNGYPPIGAVTSNGVAAVAPNGIYTQLAAAALVPVDTNLANGQAPQSVAASVFQIAAHAAGMISNTGTSTVHAATLNTVEGLITTESLSTAAGATYTFTLTNSQILLASPPPQVAMYSGTNTGGGLTLTSVTNAAGSSVFVWTNTGTTALNGTMLIAFHI